MTTKVFIPLLAIILCFNCKATKHSISTAELERLTAITQKDTLTIESNWAYPQSAHIINNTGLLPVGSGGGAINLIGNFNYFKIIKDSLSIRLPYFGVRQIATDYNTDNLGIKFDGKPRRYKSSFNSKKNAHEYYFEIKNVTESFQITLVIYPNFNTDIWINTNQRTPISYRGKVL